MIGRLWVRTLPGPECHCHPESMEEICSEDTLPQGKGNSVVEKWLGGKGHDQKAVGLIPTRVSLSSRKHGGSLLAQRMCYLKVREV